jgi:hypothetical protein
LFRLAQLSIHLSVVRLRELSGGAPAIRTKALAALASASATQISMIVRNPVTNASEIACLAEDLSSTSMLSGSSMAPELIPLPFNRLDHLGRQRCALELTVEAGVEYRSHDQPEQGNGEQ